MFHAYQPAGLKIDIETEAKAATYDWLKSIGSIDNPNVDDNLKLSNSDPDKEEGYIQAYLTGGKPALRQRLLDNRYTDETTPSPAGVLVWKIGEYYGNNSHSNHNLPTGQSK